MRFAMPYHPYDFELPCEWWAEAGMESFIPQTESYASAAAERVIIVPLADVQPLRRAVERDWRGFSKERMVGILQRIASKREISPIDVIEMPCEHHPKPQFRYAFYDGFHRFHASIAAGFKSIPAIVRPDLDAFFLAETKMRLAPSPDVT
jgi:uncharacterized ParB-like nuclease family protein